MENKLRFRNLKLFAERIVIAFNVLNADEWFVVTKKHCLVSESKMHGDDLFKAVANSIVSEINKEESNDNQNN